MYQTEKDISKYSYKTIDNIKEKRIVLRTCLNVVTDEEGRVTNATRLFEALPLIKELAFNVKNLVIVAHLGRPTEKTKATSFIGVAEALNTELRSMDVEVELVSSLSAEAVSEIQNNETPRSKRIFLLENVRYFDGEESNSDEERASFARLLSQLGDTFINDAFADYRVSASTYDIAKILPSYLGPVFEREVVALQKFSNPQKPFVAVLGGAKLSEKIDLIKSLASMADKVLVGGAMAYTLLKAKGINVGSSLIELNKLEVANEILTNYGDKIVLPVDHLISKEFSESSSLESYYTDEVTIPEGRVAIDIGKETIALFNAELQNAKSILWNGPLGVVEWEKASLGTKEVGKTIADLKDSYTLVGGGDSISAIHKFNLEGFDHISMGGGAMLSFLAEDQFPTLDVILNSK